MDYVSLEGGYTSIDPPGLAMAEPVDWGVVSDKEFMSRLGATLSPDEVKPEGYVTIYLFHWWAWCHLRLPGKRQLASTQSQNL